MTKLIELREAADDIAILADLVGEMSSHLDKIAKRYDHTIIEAVNKAFPLAKFCGPSTNAGLQRLVRDLTPPED